MIFLFFGFVAVLALVYAGYPLSMFLLARVARRAESGELPAVPPTVTVVVPAHNEAAVIEAKLENLLALSYPPGRLGAVVLSDASSDDTCERANAFLAGRSDPGRPIRILDRRERTGKSRALSEEVPKLDTDVVVFTDANAMFRPDAVERLVARFADPRVGLVCGRLHYLSEGYSFMSDEAIYWQYEDWLKRCEGRSGRLLVANGSIYAIRRELFVPVPAETADDFVMPLSVAAAGYATVYEPGAVAEERMPLRGSENFRAKARIVTRGLEAIRRYWRTILTSGPLRTTQYLLHKVMRWLTAFLLVGLLVTSALGATNPVLGIAFALQLAFYSLSIAAYLLSPFGNVPAALRLPFYFVLVNAAAMKGLFDFLRGRRRATWEKSESTRRAVAARPAYAAPLRPSPRRRGVIALVLALAGIFSLEAGVRATYLLRDALRAWRGAVPGRLALAPYEMADPVHPGNWLLRPGATMTLREVLEFRRARGWADATNRLPMRATQLGLSDDQVVFSVNSAGYKGPELAAQRTAPRILAVGDSCTFGSLLDRASYPRALERGLAAHGVAAEVVNAGVGSYQPDHILARLDALLALDPDHVVIYLGCNALFSERDVLDGALDHLYVLRAFRTLRSRILPQPDPEDLRRETRGAPRVPDARDPALRRLEGWSPSFLGKVDRIASAFRAQGAQVALVTLPALYRSGLEPSAEALRRGPLPPFTDNPYVLALLTERYNDALRQLAGERGFGLIDAAAWAEAALTPPEDYFEGALQLNVPGQGFLGARIAEELAPALAPRTAAP
jgi:cellulose synthase/poly-beta-1,6-N-acetylglucosamine synthase-like glycosyltransferase/lysophospholipase L1-like esterase